MNIEKALMGSVAKSVQQLDQQSFLKEQQAAQMQQERDLQQQQLAAQLQKPQGPGPQGAPAGPAGPASAPAMAPGGFTPPEGGPL